MSTEPFVSGPSASAVRVAEQRRGTAWSEVHESGTAATALVEGIGARRSGGNLELVR
ncbi:hypothetical protein [Actinacidiphila epipremni]|uniref:hypothetical protein n=1 Tax=Actinacidiphila epipremni TaxID=2053013 RepID=UPI0038991EC5